jgi:subtilisin family serine protease
VIATIRFKDRYDTADSALVAGIGGRFHYRFQTFPAVLVYLPESVARALRDQPHPRMVYVSIGRRGENELLEAAGWGYDYHGAGYANTLGLTGMGYVIAVIDTGVDCGHPDISCVSGTSFVPGEPYTLDGRGHGTAAAGIAAAIVGNGGYKGMAGGAQIMPVKIFDVNGDDVGGCEFSAAGIDWAVANGADVLSLSYGASWTVERCASEQEAIIRALGNGIFIAAAAGNISQLGDSVAWPARWNYANIGAVGGLTRDRVCDLFGLIGCSNPVRYWGDSSFGSQVDITAAADDVEHLLPYTTSTSESSGTSWSAPAVAGAAVLIMERWTYLRGNPGLLLEHIRYTAKMPDAPSPMIRCIMELESWIFARR